MAATFPTFFHRAVRPSAPAAEAASDVVPEGASRTLPRWLGPVVLVALVMFLRRPDNWLDPQFYLEDGFFFGQNYHHGWKALFIPYSGYLHVVIRLVAWAAGFLPLVVQPALYNAAATAISLAVIARIFRPGIRLPHKTLLAVAIPLVSHDYYAELHGNLTAIQWFLAFVPILMLIEETGPTGWRAAWDLVQLALVGLSGPLVLMSIPLFAIKWVWVARSRWNALCLGVAIFCGVVQAWFILHQPELPIIPPSSDQWLSFLARKPLGPLFFGRDFCIHYLSPRISVVLPLIVGALLIVLNRHQTVWLRVTFMFGAFSGLELLAAGSRFLRDPSGFMPVENASRYFFLPRLLLIWCLLLHLRLHTGWRRWTLWTTLALAALASARDFVCRGLPASQWTDQVAAYERGERDTLTSLREWRISMERPSWRGDAYADVLGETPLRIVPAESPVRVSIGAEPFLQLRAAKAGLFYEPPAQKRIVAGRYAAAPDAEGAVRFDVLYLAADGGKVQVLWQGQLDPAHVPADRGAHDFEAVLPPQAIGRIILAFQPVSGNTSGGGCWADIRFR